MGVVTCKYCRAPNLQWAKEQSVRGGDPLAVLYNAVGMRHSCITHKEHIVRDGGFDDHSWDTLRYHARDRRTAAQYPPVDPPEPIEEPETIVHQRRSGMDFALIHANQQAYVVLTVEFNPNGKPYQYKAESSDNWKVGDHAVVLVKSHVPHEQLQCVTVKEVHTNPVAVLNPDMLYSWVIQKIDMQKHANRTYAQEVMVGKLNEWNAARQALELAEAQKRLVASLPNGAEELAAFANLGSFGAPVAPAQVAHAEG